MDWATGQPGLISLQRPVYNLYQTRETREEWSYVSGMKNIRQPNIDDTIQYTCLASGTH